MAEGAGSLLKSQLGIGFQTPVLALQSITSRSPVGSEHRKRSWKPLEQTAAGKRLIIRMSHKNQWSMKWFAWHRTTLG
jgi:hypothetical protein